jgi:hypothetical protein
VGDSGKRGREFRQPLAMKINDHDNGDAEEQRFRGINAWRNRRKK